MKKVAVISDATSPDFFFPLWRRYYGGIFGMSNLYIVTYHGMKEVFSSFGFGNVWELNSIYSDGLRADVVSDFVSILLRTYDVVIRCDIDEMLIPEPEEFLNLRDFVEKNPLPYVTAKGIDVVELLDDAELDTSKPIFGVQRKLGIRTSSLNKTSITTIPVRWAPGFHGASVFPKFSKLFNFHLKFADIKGRIKWHDFMLNSTTVGTSEAEYFFEGSVKLKSYQNWLVRLPRKLMEQAGTDSDFEKDIALSVSYNQANKIYQGDFKTELSLIDISRFSSVNRLFSEDIETPHDRKKVTVLIDINPIGELGNRMIQYLAARKLQSEIPNSKILRPNLPEFNYKNEDVVSNGTDLCLKIPADTVFSLSDTVTNIKQKNYQRVDIHDHMQRMEWFPDRQQCKALFPVTENFIRLSKNDLLINIRAAEIVLGILHYPLVPIDFYERIISIMGLRPVFMGQIGKNKYCNALRSRFPDARFIESQGALADFETIRTATNIVVSVSTFSWLAAWLSDAENIILPMSGFLNPMHFRNGGVDLLPLDDKRYRYFKFPLNFGIPEDQAMKNHSELTKICRQVTPDQIRTIQKKERREKKRPPEAGFDEVWYAHTYLDAALEISEGWFSDPLEHYIEHGSNRYRPMPEGFSKLAPPTAHLYVDHALDKKALQSSISQWSIGRDVSTDATRAIMGIDQKPFAFHTSLEENPWWEVDLEKECLIKYIVLKNRSETDVVSGRSTPLSVLISGDGKTWRSLFTTPDALIFGRDGRSLVWNGSEIIRAKYIRLTVLRYTFLHLRQVQIFGPPS